MLPLINEKHSRKNLPVRVLQFGEGNFLRGFVDYFLDISNEAGMTDAGIAIVKPIPYGDLTNFREQDCVYTVTLRGRVNGEPTVVDRVITSVMDAVDCYSEYDRYARYARLDALRFVVSNTTEAGIVYDEGDDISLCPPRSFPGKLTKLLYERAKHFDFDPRMGLIMLPVELIDDNGKRLKECVIRLSKRWRLEKEFIEWLHDACEFTSTLVDRIITGYPKEECEELCQKWGYTDRLIVTGEPFALWVIESLRDAGLFLPLDKADLPVIFTNNHLPYKLRKVRILNGAHTSFALAAYLCGMDTVLESMQSGLIRSFMERAIFDEIIPTLPLPQSELTGFASSVIDRFDNPFVKHSLLSISLNSVSKWRARCMPSLLVYVERFGEIPARLAFSLAALIAFYHGDKIDDGALIAFRDGAPYRVMDDAAVLEFFAKRYGDAPDELARAVLSNEDFFGQDLTKLPGLQKAVSGYLNDIFTLGMRGAMEKSFAV